MPRALAPPPAGAARPFPAAEETETAAAVRLNPPQAKGKPEPAPSYPGIWAALLQKERRRRYLCPFPVPSERESRHRRVR